MHDTTRGQGCVRPEIGDRLAAYELGLLDDHECREFESHLVECAWCLEELYEHAPAVEALRRDPGRWAGVLRRARRESTRGALGERLRALLQPRFLAPAGAIAAVALALVVLLPGRLVEPGPRASSLAFVEALPYQPFELRGAGDELADRLDSGLRDYAAGRYADAARELGTVWRAAGRDGNWRDRHLAALYLGLSLLLDGRADDAIAPLQAAGESPVLPVAERGRWYLAQARLLQEDACAGVPLLESLTGSPVYGDAASAQLISVREFCDNTQDR